MVFFVIGLIGTLMSYVGFGTVGITAGSWAAAIQSFFGVVSSGSLFSIFQGWGMFGIFSKMSWIGYIGEIAKFFL